MTVSSARVSGSEELLSGTFLAEAEARRPHWARDLRAGKEAGEGTVYCVIDFFMQDVQCFRHEIDIDNVVHQSKFLAVCSGISG